MKAKEPLEGYIKRIAQEVKSDAYFENASEGNLLSYIDLGIQLCELYGTKRARTILDQIEKEVFGE